MNKLTFSSFVAIFICIGLLPAQAQIAPALRTAIKNGNTAKITRLARSGVDLNATDANGNTPLVLATHLGNTAAAQTLLKSGAKPNLANKNGTTPLMVAADNGSAELVSLLLKYKAKANQLDANGNAALFFASEKGHTKIMKQLLSARARVNRQNNEGQTPLHRAVATDQSLPLQILLEHNAYMEFEDNDGYTPALLAAATGKNTSLETLQKAGANLDAKDRKDNTALMLALKNSHADTANYLLGLQAETFDPKSPFATELLSYAAGLESSQSALDMTQFLLERGVSPTAVSQSGQTPLQAALQANNPEVVKLLLDKQNGNINARNIEPESDTLLTQAVKHQDLNSVKALLGAGADPSIRSGLGKTPLDVAVTSPSCQPGIVQELLQAGVNPNEPIFLPNGAMTPIAFLQQKTFKPQLEEGLSLDPLGTQQQNTQQCIAVLQQAGGTAILPPKDPQVAKAEKQLFAAARNGKEEKVAQLLAGGISANITDAQGNTPLMEAVRKGRYNTARQLLQAGANPDMRNGEGETAFFLAVKNDRANLFKLLLNAPVLDTYSAVLYAADKGNAKVLKELIQAGLDIDQLHEGKTLLMSSVSEKQNKRAQTLINAGADIHAVVDGYKNPLFFAWEAENSKMIQVLESKGAHLTPQGEQRLYAMQAQKIANGMTTVSASGGMDVAF